MTLCIWNLSATIIQRNCGRNVGWRIRLLHPHLVGYCLWGHKELDTTERFHFTSPRSGLSQWLSGKGSICNAGDVGDLVQSLVGKIPWREGMATLSSILTWELPWTEEPGGLYIVHEVAKSQTWVKWLSTWACTLIQVAMTVIGSYLRAFASDPCGLFWPQNLLLHTPRRTFVHAGSPISGPWSPGSRQSYIQLTVSPSCRLHSALCLPYLALVTRHGQFLIHPCEIFEDWLCVQFTLDSAGSGTGHATVLNKSLWDEWINQSTFPLWVATCYWSLGTRVVANFFLENLEVFKLGNHTLSSVPFKHLCKLKVFIPW